MKFRRSLQGRAPGVALCGLLAGCVGAIPGAPDAPGAGEAGGEAGARTAGRGGGSSGTAGAPTGGTSAAFEPAAPAMLKLTNAQLANALVDLLGPGTPLSRTLEPDLSLEGFTSVGASQATVSETGAGQIEDAALEAVKAVFADDARRRALVGCAGAPDDACSAAFLRRFARRAFRRALTTGEEQPYVDVVKQVRAGGDDAWTALSFAVAAMLQSPKFLFRSELGEPDPKRPSRLRYTSFDMASRLAFLITNAPPDEALLDVAASGGLLDEASVSAQAARLVASPRGQAGLRNFLAEKLDVPRIDLVTKDAKLFPAFTPTLVAAMREEATRLVDHVVFEQNADFLDLLTTRTTYVTRELATLYAIPNVTSDAPTKVDVPAAWERVGLLGTGGFLAAHAHFGVTSPTLRGKFVRERLLCEPIAAPPSDVNTELPADAPDKVQTLRQKLEEQHMNQAKCTACHKLMDPLGFSFERFDALGAFRDKDKGLPVDASGSLGGTTYTDLPGFVKLLRAEPKLVGCVVRHLYRYATSHAETDAEEPAIEALTAAFERNGHRLPALLMDLVTSEAFRFAAAPSR